MDYDSISKGRRRAWDALKPAEVRKKEKEEERERRKQEKKDNPGKLNYQEYRKQLREAEEERDKRLFTRAKKQIIFLVILFLISLFVYITVEKVFSTRSRAIQVEKLVELEAAIRRNERVGDLTDPVGAFATWRSAWARRDFHALTGMYSDNYAARASSSTRANRSVLAAELQRSYDRGTLLNQVRIATAFESPEIVKIPRTPWRNRELAIFRTSNNVVTNPAEREGEKYIVAFAYDERSKEWRFADMRKAQFFSVRWDYETAIRVDMADGPRAIRYDERGRAIEPEN